MFTTPCFIKVNQQNITDYLDYIGYTLNPKCNIDIGDIIVCDKQTYYTTHDIDSIGEINAIDCDTNAKLFMSIAALNNNSDYMQWFVTDADQAWVNQGMYAPKGSFELCLTKDRYNGQDEWLSSIVVPAHKATVEELIEKFTNITLE